MSDIQEGATSAPAGSETPSTAANEQTDSAAVKDSSTAANPQDTAQEPASDTGAESDTGESGEPRKPKSEFQKRIDRLTRQKGRAEREAARLAEELQAERSAKSPTQTNATTDAKPQLSNFASYDDYQEALTEWKVDQRLKAKDTEVQQSQRQQRQQAVQSERAERFQDSCEEARDKYEDFDEAVFSDDNRMPNWAGGLIADTDNPGEVAYFLAKNTKEAKRIYSLRPEKAAIELGKLVVQLATPKPKQISTAPPPTSTPAGGGRAVPKSPSKMSPDEIYSRLKG